MWTSHYLYKAVRNGPLEADVLCHEDYDAHLSFYLLLLRDQGKMVEKRRKEELSPGMKVMASGEMEKQHIERSYPFKVVHDHGNMRIYEILNGNAGEP